MHLNTLGWSFVALTLLQVNHDLPHNLVEWLALLLLVVNAYLAWRRGSSSSTGASSSADDSRRTSRD